MEERRMARLEREGGLFDPWAVSDMDDWDADAILANALLDADPMSAEAEFFAGPLVTARPMKKKKAGWKARWLSLV